MNIKFRKITFSFLLFLVLFMGIKAGKTEGRSIIVEQHGFLELRGGMRLQNDPYQKQASLGEARIQYECSMEGDWYGLKFKGDLYGDVIAEDLIYDTRESWLFFRILDFADLKIGRQALSWGTGDLVFVNDLFPKDWQSYYTGRDAEYLKSPSDSIKLSLFMGCANVDIVYTPQFDADRHVTGEYLSYWNNRAGGLRGRDEMLPIKKQDSWFEDDELGVRLYRQLGSSELAFYGYWGYWKNPGGENPEGYSIFPPLEVYGASFRCKVGKGIGNIEMAFYNSKDDSRGDNPLIRNSEIRYVVGYQQEIARDFNMSLQYYGEYKMDYDNYEEAIGNGVKRDHLRHVITFQFTKLMANQTFEAVLSGYYSPSDKDAYIRPYLSYKYSDDLVVKLGANIFVGSDDYTFFGQLKNNSNVYFGVRYSI